MVFHKVRSLGFNDGTRLWDYELDDFQDQLVQAVDGYGGGSYPLSNDLILEGGTAGKTLKWGEDGASTQLYPATASTITVTVPIPLIVHHASTYGGTPNFTSAASGVVQQAFYDAGGTQPYCLFMLTQLIRGATITAVHIGLDPVSTPAIKTTLKLRKINSSAGTASDVGTVTDTTVGGYTDYHLLSLTGLSEVVSATAGHQYFLEVTGEAGAGGAGGMIIGAAYAHFDFTQIRP